MSSEKFDLKNCSCLEYLPSLPDNSVNAVITDPPYAEVDRDYGRWTEEEWHMLMRKVVVECKRVLKPKGSAMFVLQPNFRVIGSMRTWVWEFLLYCAKEWNVVQDVYWWNTTAMPAAGCQEKYGLLRQSVKYLVWIGEPDCYRNQKSVLLKPEDIDKIVKRSERLKKKAEETEKEERVLRPSGHSWKMSGIYDQVLRNGGVTPMNILPIAPRVDKDTAGMFGHGAGTPIDLINWWIRYLTKEGDVVLDPFMGSGTTGVECVRMNRIAWGCEKEKEYYDIARKRMQYDIDTNLEGFME